MKMDLLTSLYVFMLAAFIGFEVIRQITPLLHTPLMSLTNALDAIAVVGAIILTGEHKSTLSTVLGTLAIVAAMSNVVGGFLITYLIATVLFVLALKWLSSPSTARRGVLAGEVGMLLAIAGTLLNQGIV